MLHAGIKPSRDSRRKNERQENYMSNTIKSVIAIGLVAFVAACAQQQEEEFVVVEPEPITEPAPTGKF
jgi:hypothetical protein